MTVEDAWTLTAGLPLKTVDGRYARIHHIDIDKEVFLVEVFYGNISLGMREIQFQHVDRWTQGTNALYERYR